MPVPVFEVRLRKGRENDSLLEIGVFRTQNLGRPWFVTVPFDTERKECYQVAENFAVWINAQEFGWEAVVDTRHLYTDYTNTHWRARERGAFGTAEELFDTVNEVHIAEARALVLLEELNPSLALRMNIGKPFYLQGARFIYIIHPHSRKIDVLKPEGPISLCVYITDPTVQSNKFDWAIAMWKYLVAAEEHLLTTANEFEFRLNVDTQEVTIAEDGKVITGTDG